MAKKLQKGEGQPFQPNENLFVVLQRISDMAKLNPVKFKVVEDELISRLENMLDEMNIAGVFGEHAENDPRGDSRQGPWSLLTGVQDIDRDWKKA